MTHRSRLIRVVGADDTNMRRLRALERYRDYEFRPLLTEKQTKGRLPVPLGVLVGQAIAELEREPPAAIVAYWDFPANALARHLSSVMRLPGTSLESLLACSHKMWARTIEQSVCPDNVPEFTWFDPRVDDPLCRVDWDLPFWIKPIKATGSALSFCARTPDDIVEAIATLRRDIRTFAEPFNELLALADVPDRIRRVDGYHCIAERPLAGSQCTVSGFVHDGRTTIMGVVDSLTFPGTSSFSAFVYPSRLPRSVVDRLERLTSELVEPFGLCETGFNVEYFYDKQTDSIAILEINPRFSQSHAELYSRVEGTSNHQLLVDLALGNEPLYRRGQGDYAVAAKYFHRVFRDGTITSVPDEATLDRLRARYDCEIVVQVAAGDELCHDPTEDVYCHDVAQIYLGADSYTEADRLYRTILDELSIGFEEATE
ncbi:MAG: ATP-grasp domain-containing protein [bacterium]